MHDKNFDFIINFYNLLFSFNILIFIFFCFVHELLMFYRTIRRFYNYPMNVIFVTKDFKHLCMFLLCMIKILTL